MVSLIIFVLLFNLTCILAQGVGPGPEKIVNGNHLSGEANHSKLSSNTKISDKQNTAAPQAAPFHVKVSSNPFSEKDSNNQVTQKQAKRGNEALAQNKSEPNNEQNQELAAKSKGGKDLNPIRAAVTSVSSNPPPKQNNSNITKSGKKNLQKEDVVQSGALLRGFYVFVGLSAMIMIYFIFRSYRLRHGSQPSTTVRKYGITARRSDMEMRPLELDDDDDNTLFEIGNQNAHR